jgi:hypothetical protein
MTPTSITDPLDPAYASPGAQLARLQRLLQYTRAHAPDADTEAWLRQRIDDVETLHLTPTRTS